MISPPSPDPAELVAPDGSVTVPADLTGEVLKLMIFAANERSRTTGAVPTSRAIWFLDALNKGRQRHADGGAPPDTPPSAPAAAVGRSVSEVAEAMGCSDRYVRRLLTAGRLPGRKTHGGWIVYTGQAVPDPEPPQRGSARLITANERQARDVG
ncbi:DNA binding domain-containing protein, excisionase family [Amycolatopsis tolypomycina]|uniref:DNA binding domain-containing protein, excisionase family n=1 Tax=Amycolatopsis tolypomycina TaxID=208445 RepID=A0A1H4WPI9_9PSEU|nr:helix-turn-helix domain-containing protein [Amycolatopsis tolypomycina]SEC95249.1 DNA binding domain-containing protein, excisionase family [Amycolatopsis tolypomycina]